MKVRVFVFCLLFCHLVSGQVTRVDVSMSRDDFENLYKRNLDSKKYLPVTLNIGGSVFKEGKIRFKGNTTRVYSKKPLRIKFEKSAALPPLYHGLRTLNFNAMYTDKSFMREKLVWDIFSMMKGFGPKEFGYVNVFINGVDNGLNFLIQHIDEDFLKDYGKPEGSVYEAGYDENQGDLSVMSDELLKSAYEKHVGDENDYSDLKDLIAKLNEASDAEFASVVNELFDMKTVYDWFVLNVLTMQNDTDGKNYYLYRDPTKQSQQWSIIPWDYDITFGRDGDSRYPYPSELLNDLFAYSYEPLAGPPNVLKNRMMKDPQLMAEFKQHLNDALQNIFTEDNLFPVIDETQASLDEYIKKEPVRWGTYGDFKDQVAALKYFITARRNFLLNTFINARSGENDIVTMQVSSAGEPYNFVDHDGKQVASLTFSSMSGLQKVTVRAYPSSVPPGFDGENCINRYIEIVPYPAGASFTAELKWEYLNGIDLSETGKNVAACGNLAGYNYSGGTWQPVESKINDYGDYVTFSNITEANCGAGKYFALRLPDNIDQTWKKQSNLFWQRWLDAKATDNGNIYVIGDDGNMIKSVDGGSTWKQEFLGIHQQFRSLAAPGNELLYAGGMFGLLAKSSNGGDSWQFLKSSVTENINSVLFKDPKDGWAASDGGTISFTSNGGSSWSPVKVSGALNITALCLTGRAVIAGDDNGTIFISGDDGKSWKSAGFKSNLRINRLMRKGDNEIYGVCNNGVIIHSADGGSSWSSFQVYTVAGLYAISYSDKFGFYAAGEGGLMFHSREGKDWTQDLTQYTNDIQAVLYLPASNSLIAAGNWGSIFQMR